MKKLLAVGLLGVSLFAQSSTTISWRQITNAGTFPATMGWDTIHYDQVSNKTLFWAAPVGSTSIYATTMFAYTNSTEQWARLFGNDSMSNTCVADRAGSFPGDRHPLGNQVIDTDRQRLWFWGGVNDTCEDHTVDTNGTAVTWVAAGTRKFHSSWAGELITINGVDYTVASVTDSTHLTLTTGAGLQSGVLSRLKNKPPNFKFMFYMGLTATPASNPWTRLDVTATGGPVPTATNGASAYDSDVKAIIYLGQAAAGPETWIYCPDDGVALTTKQTNSGCTFPGRWAQTRSTADTQPPGRAYAFGMMHYVPGTVNRIIQFGGQNNIGTPQNQTWSYETQAKTWTQKCLTACTNPPTTDGTGYVSQAPFIYNSNSVKLIYRRKDTRTDYEYDPVADFWTTLAGAGTGPVGFSTATFDPTTNKIFLNAASSTSNPIVFWEGQLSGGTVTGQFKCLAIWPSGNCQRLLVEGLLTSLSAGSTATVTLNHANISGGLPLTVQEMLGGATGVARTAEPFSMTVVLADSYAITTSLPGGAVTGFTLTGTDSVAGTDIATDGVDCDGASNSNFICIDTGTQKVEIKKANYNVVNRVIQGATTVVASSSSATRGLVLMGPPAGGGMPSKVNCTGGTCTTVYSSANDASSFCTVERNGPVQAVIRCIGTHKDAGGTNPYMQFTTRQYFSRGKTAIRMTSVLRNANYDTSATPSPDVGTGDFNPAYKQFAAYDVRVAPNTSGSLTYAFGCSTLTTGCGTGSVTGTVSTDAYLYQGHNLFMWAAGYYSVGMAQIWNDYTTDTGYRISNAGSNVASSTATTATHAVPGWGDVADSAGVGVTIGQPYLAANYPKSLEFHGSDMRIGLNSQYSTQVHTQAWPQWKIHEVYMNFHATAVTAANARDEFLRSQYPLMIRPSVAYLNSTGVYEFPIVDPAEEDSFYYTRSASTSPTVPVSKYCYGGGPTNCIPDYGIADSNFLTIAFRNYIWPAPGGSNQEEFRWNNMMKFWQRGHTGRFQYAKFFYRMQAEIAWPHSDGTTPSDPNVNSFTWRSRPCASCTSAELDGFGRPSPSIIVSTNYNANQIAYPDSLHNWWFGMTEYYLMTGDETMREAMIPLKDYYGNQSTFQGNSNGTATSGNTGMSPGRASGIHLYGAARFAAYLKSIGDSFYSTVEAQADVMYSVTIRPNPCLSGYPVGCTPPAVVGVPNDPPGINRKRGYVGYFANRGSDWCNTGTGSFYRSIPVFHASIVSEGLLVYRRYKGPSWTYYKESGDLAYGIGQWATTEGFLDDGTNVWYNADPHLGQGFRYGIYADKSWLCPGGTTGGNTHAFGGNQYDNNYNATVNAGIWTTFYNLYLTTGRTSDWERKFKMAFDRLFNTDPLVADKGVYQIGNLIHAINHPTPAPLQNITPSIVDNGAGSYSLSWSLLSGTTSHRVKWSTLQIVDQIGFDVVSGSFTGSPATQENWWAAVDAGTEPSCPGSTCSITLNTGQTGLTSQNFSVRAYATDAAPTGVGSRFGGRVLGGRVQ